jgi:hypothetical protein
MMTCATRAGSIWLATIATYFTALPYAAFAAQQTGAIPALSEATSPKIHDLVILLADPSIQARLKQQDDAKSAAASRQDTAEQPVSQVLDARLSAIREHTVTLSRTVPDFRNQFWRGRARITADVIRRAAYAMIKRAFDENGIKFAFPTVQVAGEAEASTGAVAHRALESAKPAAA